MKLNNAAICLLGLLTTPTFASAEFIINGSFETGDLSGWTATGSSQNGFKSIKHVDEGTLGGVGPFGPNLAIFNTGDSPTDGVLSQDVATVTGQTYDLSFYYGAFGNQSNLTQALDLSIVDIDTNTNIFTTSIDNLSGTRNLQELLDLYEYRFTAIGNTTQIRFADMTATTFGADGVLDNVSLTAVPEPTTIALISTAAFGAFVHGRKRIRKK